MVYVRNIARKRQKPDRRLKPEKTPTEMYEVLWKIVDGAVLMAFDDHPEYIAQGISKRTVRNSVVKRVVGTLTGFVEQSTGDQHKLVDSSVSGQIETRQQVD